MTTPLLIALRRVAVDPDSSLTLLAETAISSIQRSKKKDYGRPTEGMSPQKFLQTFETRRAGGLIRGWDETTSALQATQGEVSVLTVDLDKGFVSVIKGTDDSIRGILVKDDLF